MVLTTPKGPIIRISPAEVHIDDPAFFSMIYSSSELRDKSRFQARITSGQTSAFGTPTHDLHRLRRSALDPFFSKSQIKHFTPWIQDRTDALCRRFRHEFAGTNRVATLNDTFSCLTTDLIMEYLFSENYNLVENPDFIAPLNKALEHYLKRVHWFMAFPWLLQLQLTIIPRAWVEWLDPRSESIFAWMGVSLAATLWMRSAVKASDLE